MLPPLFFKKKRQLYLYHLLLFELTVPGFLFLTHIHSPGGEKSGSKSGLQFLEIVTSLSDLKSSL